MRSPIVVKVLVLLTIWRCFAAPGYGAYYLFFGS